MGEEAGLDEDHISSEELCFVVCLYVFLIFVDIFGYNTNGRMYI